jgi:hypothetical protein
MQRPHGNRIHCRVLETTGAGCCFVDLANFAGQISIAPVFIAENKAELLWQDLVEQIHSGNDVLRALRR